MATNVYPLPTGLVQSIATGGQNQVVAERNFFGGPATVTEVTPRRSVTIEGIVHDDNHAAFGSWMDRLSGGTALAAIQDIAFRRRIGGDGQTGINSSGTEYWRESGAMSGFPGGTPTSPWRTVACQANGAASEDDTSIAVDGLLASEAIPAGMVIRIGVWRYIVRSAVTANGSGEATLALAHPLRGDVADNAEVKIPGDLTVYQMAGRPSLGAADQNAVSPFSIPFREVYSSESWVGGFTWVVD